ncbi:hypothetical protein [Dongia sp.]|uniref:hypothetical protein n=1 Tax=Dongia sp. TaxID=1977262 RepID=UPI0035B4ABD7
MAGWFTARFFGLFQLLAFRPIDRPAGAFGLASHFRRIFGGMLHMSVVLLGGGTIAFAFVPLPALLHLPAIFIAELVALLVFFHGHFAWRRWFLIALVALGHKTLL